MHSPVSSDVCLHVCFGNVTNPTPPQSNPVLYTVLVDGTASQLSPKQRCDQWEKVEADARKVLAASSVHHFLVLWRIGVDVRFVRVGGGEAWVVGTLVLGAHSTSRAADIVT